MSFIFFIYEMLFTYIPQNPRVVRMAELYTFLHPLFKSQGDMEINESMRIHFRREHEWEFRGTPDFEDLSTNRQVAFIAHSLSRLDLAKLVMEKS